MKARHTDGRVWEVESNADKSRVFQETFFLKPPADHAQDDNDDDANYSKLKFRFAPIMDTHIWRAIAKLGPFKVPGTDGIMNIVFIQCADLLVLHLAPIYRATFELKTYPDQWKSLTTVMLRKPSKPC